MDLIMTEYQPRARCHGPGTFPLSTTRLAACALILETMQVSAWDSIFGPASDPAAEFITPFVILTRGAFHLSLVYEFAYGFTL